MRVQVEMGQRRRAIRVRKTTPPPAVDYAQIAQLPPQKQILMKRRRFPRPHIKRGFSQRQKRKKSAALMAGLTARDRTPGRKWLARGKDRSCSKVCCC